MAKRDQPLVRICAPLGQSPDDNQQHMKRWRQELAFAVAQHPDLAAKARRLGIFEEADLAQQPGKEPH